jgi:hypothetical protein
MILFSSADGVVPSLLAREGLGPAELDQLHNRVAVNDLAALLRLNAHGNCRSGFIGIRFDSI